MNKTRCFSCFLVLILALCVCPGFMEAHTLLYQSYWRGNQGWARTVPLNNGGKPDWGAATPWQGPIAIANFPGTGSIQSQGNYVIGDILYQGYWRGNQGWTRKVSIEIVSANPLWSTATPWTGPIPIANFPGTGDIQSQGSFVIEKTLYQGYWRGNQGWARTVPIVNNKPKWSDATPWNGPIPIANFPGTGDIQSQGNFVIDKTLYQGYWRGNQGWARTVPIVNNMPKWSDATPWNGPISIANFPGTGDIQSQGSFALVSILE